MPHAPSILSYLISSLQLFESYLNGIVGEQCINFGSVFTIEATQTSKCKLNSWNWCSTGQLYGVNCGSYLFNTGNTTVHESKITFYRFSQKWLIEEQIDTWQKVDPMNLCSFRLKLYFQYCKYLTKYRKNYFWLLSATNNSGNELHFSTLFNIY
jgi:hypothetical protein